MAISYRDAIFLENRLLLGKKHSECYREYNPETTQSDESCRRSGWNTLQRILGKLDDKWRLAMCEGGIGPDAVIPVFAAALQAKKSDQVDWPIRLRAARMLSEIHGLIGPEHETTLKVEKPLPLYIVMEDEETPESRE